MATFKCKMCGGTLEIQPGESVAVCDSCGSRQTIPNLSDERRANLYDRANHFRRANEFDKAMALYEQILNEDNNDAEAHWSVVLCRYGIEYVEDPATHKRVPTVNRAQYTSIFADEDYKEAYRLADGYQRDVYQTEAKAIDEIQKGILAISQKEAPFDVFISYKETDSAGRRTPDSVLATDLYQQLTKEGFKVFLSRITLEDKLGQEYEPYIFAALHSAKVMVVVGTRPEYFNAVWVKNEWSRYLALIRAGEKKTLIPAYRDMDPYDLPDEFSHLLAQDMGKLGFMQDLIRGIKKLCANEEPKPATKETVVVSGGSASTASLLRRAFLFLEDGEWSSADEYCERVLDIDPENAQAYLGKLMAELRVKRQSDLESLAQPFDDRNNYQKTVRFADAQLKETLRLCNTHIRERNETKRKDDIYSQALSVMKTSSSESSFKSAANQFSSISGYKDADAKARECLEKAEESRKNSIYNEAKAKMCGNAADNYEEAIRKFRTVSGWRDADRQIVACQQKIEEIRVEEERRRVEQQRKEEAARIAREKAIKKRKRTTAAIIVVALLSIAGFFIYQNILVPAGKYAQAKSLMDSGRYAQAIEAFEELGDYKDSADQIVACQNAIKEEQYQQAVELNEAGKYEEAYAIFSVLTGYKDVDNIIKTDKNIAAAHAAYLTQFDVGKTVTFGSYEQDNKTADGKEEIEWLVLAREDNKALLISKYALDCQQYNSSFTDITWEKCTLRSWLNSTFLNAAFSSEEQKQILTTTVTADKNPSYSTNPGNNTSDKVFLMSITEANKYFSSDSSRQCKPTTYAEAQGCYVNSDYGTCWWWLRSPGFNQYDAAGVDTGGSVDYGGYSVNRSNDAIRPALWINLDS